MYFGWFRYVLKLFELVLGLEMFGFFSQTYNAFSGFFLDEQVDRLVDRKVIRLDATQIGLLVASNLGQRGTGRPVGQMGSLVGCSSC